MRITTAAAYLFLGGFTSAFGQSVISAKAGVVHYTEGDVAILAGGKSTPVETHTGGKFTEMKDGQELTTTEGRAEVLLNPGVFLRLGENSTVKMISTRLSDARLELTRGVALVEVADVAKDNAVTMLVKDAAVSFTKMGLIRIEAETGIRAYKGEVQVIVGDTPQILKEGREMQFANGNLIAKFDAKQGDPLYRWANRRAEYLAMANIASANMVQKSYNGGISGLGTGMWFFNSYYGMMTYLPGSGMYRSPYGYMYYSPARVIRYNQAYMPAPNNPGNGGFGGSGMGQGRAWNSDYGYNTTMGRSAGAVSMPAPSAGAPAAAVSAAPAGRGADVSTGRGGGGGRGR